MKPKLQRLEAHLVRLEQFRKRYTLEDVRSNPYLEWALRYGLLEAVQTVVDISCHLIVRDGIGTPETYASCVDLLERAGYVTPDLAARLRGMVGLRNRLVHEYAFVDVSRLYAFLDHLEDFRTFLRQIAPRIT